MEIYNIEGYLDSFDAEKLWFKTYSRVTPDQAKGPKIILVHGLSNDAQVWEGVIDLLLTKHPHSQIVTYDLRGHGASSQKFNHLTKLLKLEEVHAKDLEKIINAFGGRRPILVGHSFGGIVIQEYLLKTRFWPFSGKKPRGVVLVGTNTRTFSLPNFNRQKIMTALMKLEASKKSLPQKRTFEFYQKNYSQKLDASPLHFFYAYSNMNRENFFRHWIGLANWHNINPAHMIHKLGGQGHLTLIYGTKDQIFPINQVKDTLATYPEIKGVQVSGGHAIPIQYPDVIAEEISAFL